MIRFECQIFRKITVFWQYGGCSGVGYGAFVRGIRDAGRAERSCNHAAMVCCVMDVRREYGYGFGSESVFRVQVKHFFRQNK